MCSFLYNEDTGDINNIENVDFIIIGMSKCGTTTLFQSLNDLGESGIKYHSDYTLERVYKTTELTTKGLVALAKNPKIFVPYREPIRRRISQYHQYNLTGSLKEFCLGDFTELGDDLTTEVDEDAVYANIANATGIDVLKHYFKKRLGILTVSNVTFYNLESIDNLGIPLRNGRVSSRAKPKLEFSDAELDEIYGSKYIKHFYTKRQIEEFKLWVKE